jgi:excinuclease ABC subunit A
MAFLADASVVCDQCNGQRFTPETLEVRWRNLNVGEILQLDAEQALEVFQSVPRIARPLQLLVSLGLGYLRLGQPSNTLSGGEAQRIKLVAELTRAQSTGKTVYIMDEPTTGLHRDDTLRLILMIQQLVERGDTVIVIEHHPDMMTAADWIVDLGPDAGEQGGEVVAMGSPETIAANPHSHTGNYLQQYWKSQSKNRRKKVQEVTQIAVG